MDHRMFNAQVEAFALHYRILVWDARGHSLSQPIGSGFTIGGCVEDMLAIMSQEGIVQAVFCGQSMGGYIVQYIYQKAPECVNAIIFIGCTPIAIAYNRREIFALKATLTLFRIWPYSHLTKTIARTTALKPDVQAYALNASRQINRADFISIWQAVTLAINENGDPNFRINRPLLLIHGDQDRTGTISRDMPLWAKSEKDITYRIIPQAGHNANQDNPEDTNRIISTFLEDKDFF